VVVVSARAMLESDQVVRVKTSIAETWLAETL